MGAVQDANWLRPQDMVLTILGAHVRIPGQRVWSGGMVEILEELGFTNGGARAALTRLVNRDLLARSRDGRRIYYTPTQRANALLSQGDDRIFNFGRADPVEELWTVLWHAIPEDQRISRSRLVSRLRFLGFGSVQDAIWVAPRDCEQELIALLHQLDIAGYASVIVGQMSVGLPPIPLVAQAWRLEQTRERYQAFLAEFEGLCKAPVRRRLSAAEAFRKRILLLHRFLGFLSIDPELPKSIDQLADLRARAVACFDEVYTALERPATDYFWHKVGPDQRG